MKPIEPITLPFRFVRQLGDLSRCPASVVQGWAHHAGIAPNLFAQPNARITVEQFARFYRQAMFALDDETPAFFSRRLRPGTLKFLCLSMLDAPNLSVAMYRLSGFFKLVLDDLSFELLQHGPYVRMALVEHVDLGPQRQLILEIMLMLVQGVASWMAASRMTFPRIDLAFPVSPDEPDYTHFFPGPVFAGQSLTALYFDPANLGAPIRQEKNALAAFLLRAPADWIRISVKERHVTFRVRDYLEANLQISPGISEVAQALHFSTRTLARRLEEEGSRFQHIKDTLRRDIAIDYICRTDDSIADIGLRLGFDNATAFNRAFKQWTGSSPGAYRKGIGKTPPLPSAVQMAE